MDLKQVALVAEDLAPVREEIFAVLGLENDFADVGVGEFGLVNSVMTIGDTFLEVVSPVEQGTTAGRLLARRQGDGGYMVIAQVAEGEIRSVSERVDALNIRKVWQVDRDEVTAFHLHPRDIGAAIVSFDEMRPVTEWLWAGPDWRSRTSKFVSRISGVTLQAADPEVIAAKWSRTFDRDLERSDAVFILRLDQGDIHFEEAKDGRGDGVAAVRFDSSMIDTVIGIADERQIPRRHDELIICGTRFQFREVK